MVSTRRRILCFENFLLHVGLFYIGFHTYSILSLNGGGSGSLVLSRQALVGFFCFLVWA